MLSTVVPARIVPAAVELDHQGLTQSRSRCQAVPELIRLGVFLNDHKARRDRLDEQQGAALAELGGGMGVTPP